MRIKLPSNGCMGVTYIEMRQPKVGDLRKVPELSKLSALAKTQFVEMLVDDVDALHECSIFDKEYLFLLAAGAINLNKFEFNFTCDNCCTKSESTFDLSSQEVIDLPEGTNLNYSKEVAGKVYNFSMPTVQDEIDIVKFIEENDLDYDKVYPDLLVATILNYRICKESLDAMLDLPMVVYYAAICYYQYAFHGVRCNKECVCPKCGTTFNVIVPTADRLLSVDTMSLMSRFAKLSGSIDFNSFKDLTLPELVALESAK